MAHSTAGAEAWGDSRTTTSDQKAASSAARIAATNHDTGDERVSKTNPASHPDGAQFPPNQTNGR